MDLSLTEAQQLIVNMIRRFVREDVAPLEDSLDPDEDTLPPELFGRLVKKPRKWVSTAWVYRLNMAGQTSIS